MGRAGAGELISVSLIMHLCFEIFTPNLDSFLNHWASKYDYPAEDKYTDNIGKPLNRESLRSLFEWKNGTGSGISARKVHSIVTNYPITFDGDRRARYLDHQKEGGPIWNIFFLHCLDPEEWPIFDQHTYRAMRYITTGRIEEIGSTNKKKYSSYENEYILFVATFTAVDRRMLDKALFAFGRFLKTAAKYA